MTHHQPDTHLCTQQDTYHDEPRDLGLQITCTRNMGPLTKHNMVEPTAALEAIDAENAYSDSVQEDTDVDLLRTRSRDSSEAT
jgi:hypothetical protein